MFDRSPIYYKLFCIKLSTYLKSEKIEIIFRFQKRGTMILINFRISKNNSYVSVFNCVSLDSVRARVDVTNESDLLYNCSIFEWDHHVVSL